MLNTKDVAKQLQAGGRHSKVMKPRLEPSKQPQSPGQRVLGSQFKPVTNQELKARDQTGEPVLHWRFCHN